MASGLALAAYGLLLVPGAVLVWRRPVVALYDAVDPLRERQKVQLGRDYAPIRRIAVAGLAGARSL